MAIRIGTSGFMYQHWRGRFYPPSARGSELELYARTFDTVELNVTFYRMPGAATFRTWATRVPDDFVFAVKASRYLTHVRRLQAPQASVDFLVERARGLGSLLGPILIQLPPDLELDLQALESTLDAFPADVRIAVEPRHPSWFVEPTRGVLAERKVALCVADRRGPVTPLWRTADWSYLRFHGGTAAPPSCYSEQALEAWAERVETLWGQEAEGFAFFNNDPNGCALRDASVYARALERRGLGVARVPVVSDDIVLDPPGPASGPGHSSDGRSRPTVARARPAGSIRGPRAPA